MDNKKEHYISLLCSKYKETGRYPKKSDFSEEEVSGIKSLLGPWPRALEAAGIKEPPEISKAEYRKQKRIEKKRAMNAMRKEMKKHKIWIFLVLGLHLAVLSGVQNVYAADVPAVSTEDTADSLSDSWTEVHADVLRYIRETVTAPVCNSTGGEWAVLALARSGIKDTKWYNGYYYAVLDMLEQKKTNILDERGNKSTENTRAIIGLSAIGADASAIGGYDLTAPLTDFDFVGKQGINGYIYALIALDCGGYGTKELKDQLIQTLLSRQLETGGWALSGETPDADITGMVIQALAPYYGKNEEVKAAVDTALLTLSDMQSEDGTFLSYGTANSESCAQVLCALSLLGIDAEDSQAAAGFIKNGHSVLDALLSFRDDSTGGIRHVMSGKTNQMATEQAAYALTAYSRLKKNQKGLYDMTDADCLYICDTHTWDAGKVTRGETESEGAEKTFTCLVCGETKKVVYPKTESPDDTKFSAPKKTTIRKLTSPKKRQLKVWWNKKSGVSGYQLQISTSSGFKRSKTTIYNVKKQAIGTKTIKTLKSGKKYYVRIRTYKTGTMDGKTVTKYSKWSGKKKIKVK